MPGGVFICYRREDSAGFAGRIYDRLKNRLGHESVFLDVDKIPAGLDFVEVLSEQVGRCDALIAIIGGNWLASADKDNRRRLDDPNDVVRIEIEAALNRNVPVIPVLVDGAAMPNANDLPDSLRKLARRQGIEISHNRFDSDAERLTDALVQIARAQPGTSAASRAAERSPQPARGGVQWLLPAAAVAVIAGGAAFLAMQRQPPQPAAPSAQPHATADATSAAPPTAPPSPPTTAAAQPKQAAKSTTSESPLAAEQERELRPGASFKECADCPEMIVVPGGTFMMGSPDGKGASNEHPQHKVTIAQPFAVARFMLTFDEWDACTARGGCPADVSDRGWGRGRRPAIKISRDYAHDYVGWLSRTTGKPYRLLSEAEYEYTARAGARTNYPWGDDIRPDGRVKANCRGCGSQWDDRQTAPVGSFDPNAWDLFDMVGNVWEWTEDCWNLSYNGAPSDGSAWTDGDCGLRVVRGGAWDYAPSGLRSAFRGANAPDSHDVNSFRVARTLGP